MASACRKAKARMEPKFKTRKVNRCNICGRVRGYYRKFALCRHCFRKLALSGMLPGVRKASW